MSISSRIALLVQAQGARRAATDVDAVAKSTDKLDRKTRGAGKSMRAAGSDARGFRDSVRGVAGAAKLGAVAAAGLGVAVAKGAVTEFREAYKVGRQTRAVIAATGGAANVTAKEVENLAGSLSLKAGIDDEAIQQGANLLLTFKKVRNEVGAGNKIFDRANQAAVDLSAAGFGSIENTAKQMGKALNDPVKGISALGRAGVTFTADQKKTIASLVKQNRTLEAQKIILKEVESQVGGSAAAQADPIDRATVAWGNLLETLGGLLAPTVTAAATEFADFIEGIQNGTGAGGVFRDVIVGIADGAKTAGRAAADAHEFLSGLVRDFRDGKPAIVALAIALGALTAGFVAYRTAMIVGAIATGGMTAAQTALNVAMSLNPVGLIVAAIVALGVAVVVAYRKVGWFRDAVNTTWAALKSAWGWLRENGPKILQYTPLGQLIKHFDKVRTVAWVAFRSFKNAAVSAFNIVKVPVKWLVDKIGWILDKIPDVVGIAGDIAGVAGDVAGGALSLLPGRASGGPVRAGEDYVVGEEGPEIFRPRTSGEIIPNDELATPVALTQSMGAAAGDRPVDLTIPVYLDGRKVGTGVRRVALRDLLAEAPA